MLLSEYIATRDLFGAIYTNGSNHTPDSFPFIEDTTPEVMNAMLGFEYGDRTMFNKVEVLTTDMTAKMLVGNFYTKWDQLVRIEAANLNVTAVKTDKTTEAVTSSENRTNNRNDVSKVSGFNSTDLVDNEGATSSSTDGMTGAQDKTITKTSGSIGEIYSSLDSVTKNGIIKTVLRDVASFITLSVY
jgi:hypothetical protein